MENETKGTFRNAIENAAADAVIGVVNAIGFGLKVSIRVLIVGGAFLGLGLIGKKLDK